MISTIFVNVFAALFMLIAIGVSAVMFVCFVGGIGLFAVGFVFWACRGCP